MEAAVLLGLVVAGYLKNKEDSGDNPIIPSVNGNPTHSNGENVYESGNFYQETKKEVKDLVENNMGENIISDKNLDRQIGIGNNDMTEGFQELIYSNNLENTLIIMIS